ncbi:hypothetical protein HU200_053786 [Digitaria exilis]|uniref:Uncharacterized protein n=1 Tax=Digitaria exilis TaxID=1010633 RepID=A0A835E620_9POAL|nr:hypothetical protein HU200_053786 [Digitaria exilis]
MLLRTLSCPRKSINSSWVSARPSPDASHRLHLGLSSLAQPPTASPQTRLETGVLCKLRKLLLCPLFPSPEIVKHDDVMSERILRHWGGLRDGRQDDLHGDHLALLGESSVAVPEDLDAVVVVLENYDKGSIVLPLQSEHGSYATEMRNKVFIPAYRFLLTRKNRRVWQLDREIKRLLDTFVNGLQSGVQDHDMKDFMSFMAPASGDDELLFAGKEMLTSLLTWATVALAMDVLAMDAEWQDRAHREVHGVGGHGGLRPPEHDVELWGADATEFNPACFVDDGHRSRPAGAYGGFPVVWRRWAGVHGGDSPAIGRCTWTQPRKEVAPLGVTPW